MNLVAAFRNGNTEEAMEKNEHAAALGRMGKGKAKSLTSEERERRANRLREMNRGRAKRKVGEE